jgi:signal peptidase I
MDTNLEQRSKLGCELIADVARSFGEVRLKVTGASMMPAVWPNDVIVVRRGETAEFQPGTIVLYRREGKLIAHRITSLHRDHLITRGDSLRHDDQPIEKSDIVGQVIAVIRNGHSATPHQASWQRLSSFILRRSDFCRRMALHIVVRLRRHDPEEISWAI